MKGKVEQFVDTQDFLGRITFSQFPYQRTEEDEARKEKWIEENPGKDAGFWDIPQWRIHVRPIERPDAKEQMIFIKDSDNTRSTAFEYVRRFQNAGVPPYDDKNDSFDAQKLVGFEGRFRKEDFIWSGKNTTIVKDNLILHATKDGKDVTAGPEKANIRFRPSNTASTEESDQDFLEDFPEETEDVPSEKIDFTEFENALNTMGLNKTQITKFSGRTGIPVQALLKHLASLGNRVTEDTGVYLLK